MKAVTLQYCVDTLRNNTPDKNYERLIELKKELHERRMGERDGAIDVTKEVFEDVVKQFKTKPTKTYNFLLKAGERYRPAIYMLCKIIIEEDIP